MSTLHRLNPLGSLRGKLIVALLLMGILPTLIVGIMSYTRASSSLNAGAFDKLAVVQGIHKSQIEGYFDTMRSQLAVLKNNPFIVERVAEFDESFMAAGGSIDSNEWRASTRKWDSLFQDMAREFKWADILLMCPHGSIVYTMAKERDLGLSVNQEPLKTSPLGKAFVSLQTSGQDIGIADFERYEPSKGEPALFMIARVREGGEIVGHVGFRISVDAINAIMQQHEGLGQTGETYLVGPDKLMRSDSRLDPVDHSVIASFAGTVEANGVDTEATRNALAGKSGTEIIIDYNGNSVLSAYAPLNVSGLNWAIIAEIDKSEALAASNSMLQLFLIVLGASIAAIS